jgi:peptide chain release factor subunit 1
LINKLDNTKGNGTSMVTLVVPPKEDINKATAKMTQELSSAAGIKSKTTR